MALVTDNNVGTATFAVRIVYNAAMNTNLNPVVTFTPDVASTLSFDRAWSWWVSSTAFVARYDVADADVVVSNITIGVTGAYDATGNIQTAYTGANAFSIDTLNPPPGALPRAAVRRISNPSYTDAVLSSGTLNLTVGAVSAPTSQKAALSAVDRALLYSGTWLEA